MNVVFRSALLATYALSTALLLGSGANAAEGAIPPDAAPFQWVSIGPTFIEPTGADYDKIGSSGRVSNIIVLPSGILAATANGGVWKRDAASDVWSPITDTQPDLAFGAVAAAPSNPNIIYAGTGEDHASLDCGFGEDVYKSTDGGSTWRTLAPLPGLARAGWMQTSSIVIDPADADVVWLGGTLGVYRSDNGGLSWSTIMVPDATLPDGTSAAAPIVDLKLNPSNSKVAYFTDRRHIMKYDPSATPALVDVSVPAPTNFEKDHPYTTYAIALAIAPSNGNVLYASYAFTGNFSYGCLAGLFKSTNGGIKWQQIEVPATSDYLSDAYFYRDDSTGCQGWYDNVLTVDPLDPNHLVAAGVAVADFAVNSVTSPTQRNLSDISRVHPDHHALAFDTAGNLYDGSDGGVWYFPHSAFSSGSTETGQNLSRGLSVTQFSSGGSWLPDGSFFAGSQDNGTELYSLGTGGWTWKRLAMGDGGYTAADPRNSNILYHEYYEGQIERSENHGATWTGIAPPFNGQDVSWVMPFVMDPSNARRMYAGADQVFVSTTGGVPTISAPGWNTALTQGFTAITSIDEKPGGDELVVGDSQGKVAYTFDSGTKWHYLQFSGPIRVAKVDPFAAGTILVGYLDQTHPFTGHLTRITGANTSTPVQANWDLGIGAPIDSLLLTRAVIFAGTDRGVYIRKRVDDSWSHQTSTQGAPAVPSVPVVDLKLLAPSSGGGTTGIIVALTHGRGAWRSNDIKYLLK